MKARQSDILDTGHAAGQTCGQGAWYENERDGSPIVDEDFRKTRELNLMKATKNSSLILLNAVCTIWLTLLLFSPSAFATTFYSKAATANWAGTNNAWSTANCGGAGAGNAYPGKTAAGDVVNICPGDTITLAANPPFPIASLTFNGGTTASNLKITGFTLVVTGAVTMNAPTTAGITSTFTVSTGTLTNTGGSVSITGSNTVNSTAQIVVTTGTVTTGSLTITGGTSATGIALMSVTTGTITSSGAVTLNGMTANARLTSTGISTINVAGNFSNGGTFAAVSSTVNLTGANSTLGGSSATIFNNLTISKTVNNDVTINSSSPLLSPTVSGVLTLTSGHVITVGTNDLGLGTTGTVPGGGSAASHVAGAVQKNYNAASASMLTFPVGDGINYTPVVIQDTAGFTGGSLTISTTGGDHPGTIANLSGIDQTKSVNRYWKLTPAAGLTGTYNATFNYINGPPVDLDSGATPAKFIVKQWDGTSWFPTTLNAPCSSTQCAIKLETRFGDFAIGEPLVNVYKGVNNLIDLRENY